MTSEPAAARAAGATASDTLARERRRLLNRVMFKAYLWARVPLAACAGLRVMRLDDEGCTVRLPGGWRTRNPFGSTYFAAQCMAAEMSTGAPALILAGGAPVSVALIVVELRASFTRRLLGESRFVFSEIAEMKAAVDRAAAQDEPVSYTARPAARGADGALVSEFAVTWSFKRRATKA
jgi:hypothetical protein